MVVLQEVKLPNIPNPLTRNELYALRDRSGLPRQEFYLQMMENMELKETLEVGMDEL